MSPHPKSDRPRREPTKPPPGDGGVSRRTPSPRPHPSYPADPDAPYVKITRHGCWLYCLELHHGLMVQWPGRYALGRRRAERKARRWLRAYRLERTREALAVEIREGDPW